MQRKILSTISLLSCGIFLLSTLIGWVDKPFVNDPKIIAGAVTKSLLLLQKSGDDFINRSSSKCASCHHNILTSMAAEIARQKGIPVIDSFEEHNAQAIIRSLAGVGNPNLPIQFLASNFVAPYALLGLYAEKYPADFYTDISVDYLLSQAKPDGSFLAESGRPPLETGDVHLTSMAIRAIQVYASAAKKSRVNALTAKTRNWLERSLADQQQELVFQLLGMHWCGSNTEHEKRVTEKLTAMQHDDGGWSQLPTMKSDAYATGQTLYALYESGMMKPEDAVYQKGLAYLLKTQEPSGAWIVETRAYPIQPFVNSNFPPHDENQFISATATNWAIMAMMDALPDKK